MAGQSPQLQSVACQIATNSGKTHTWPLFLWELPCGVTTCRYIQNTGY